MALRERLDAELVAAARIGEADSFSELHRRHYVAAAGIAYSILSDRHLADDAAQEAFAIVCRDLVRLRRNDKFVHWLNAICRKMARCLMRWHKPHPDQFPFLKAAERRHSISKHHKSQAPISPGAGVPPDESGGGNHFPFDKRGPLVVLHKYGVSFGLRAEHLPTEGDIVQALKSRSYRLRSRVSVHQGLMALVDGHPGGDKARRFRQRYNDGVDTPSWWQNVATVCRDF